MNESAASAGTWLAGAAGLIAGFLLLVGFLTPLAGMLTGLCALAIGFSLIPNCTKTLFPSLVPAILALTNLLAIMMLGPGAFSVDARLFGRREIIIPPSSPPRR